MNDHPARLVLPYQTVRRRLAETAEHLGCAPDVALALAQSAWHLCNRGLVGVDYLLQYLRALQRHPEASRDAVAREAAGLFHGLTRGRTRCSAGPIAPLLMLPMLGHELERTAGPEAAILLSFRGQDLVYSKPRGLRIRTGDPAALLRIDPFDMPTCTATRVQFDVDVHRGLSLALVRNQKLSLPRAVCTPEGPLALQALCHPGGRAPLHCVDSGAANRQTVR